MVASLLECAQYRHSLARGFLYLVAIMDWFSRYVLAWRTSITLESAFWGSFELLCSLDGLYDLTDSAQHRSFSFLSILIISTEMNRY